jgi:hypothetical protein
VFLQTAERNDAGQATIALAGVLAIAFFAGLALALFGQATVHRARARNAADAVALAAVDDVVAAEALSDWYLDQGVTIEHDGGRAIARSGPSQAAAWATLGDVDQQPAPVLVAILARAEQLVGVVFAAVRWHELSFELQGADARQLAVVAADLGLCEPSVDVATTGWISFVVC